MACRIDHITITAPSLESGCELVRARLGVAPGPGGEHPRMGTHNLLLRLGDGMFLEVIAINPGAPRPARPRWFGLDDLPGDAGPALACWVARCDDVAASLASSAEPLGRVEPMFRGSLEWLISIPEDGRLVLGGAAPSLIQWQALSHPAAGMPDMGCTLMALELLHPDPARVERLLRSLGVSEPGVPISVAAGAAPGLVAHIRTPQGLRTLGTPAS